MLIDEMYPRRDSSSFCAVEIETIDALKANLKESVFDLTDSGNPSRKLKTKIADKLLGDGWKSNFVIDSDISNEYPSAIFTIDYFMDLQSSTCGHKHRFLLEISFDNRQNLGTNLLKFEVASKKSEIFGHKILPIIICADEVILKKYKWDGAIADVMEYDHAIRIPYKNVITHAPVLISVRENS